MHCANILSKIAIPSLSTICTISKILAFRNTKVCSADLDYDCHMGLNPRSKRASLSLQASLAALRAGYKREAQVIKNTTKK